MKAARGEVANGKGTDSPKHDGGARFFSSV